MCNADQQTMDKIEQTVDGFVGEGRMFTAYEVSLVVNEWRKGKGLPWIRHKEMKQDVHLYVSHYVSQASYCQQLQDVGAPDKAFVYYPQGGDPTQYKPLPRHGHPVAPVVAANSQGVSSLQGTSSSPAVSPVPMPTITMGGLTLVPSHGNGNTNDANSTTPDKFGRLNVPATLVREAGLAPGMKAFVFQEIYQSKPCLVVTSDQAYDGTQVTEYTVEPKHGVKIRPSIIERANLGKGPYEFLGSANLVRVCDKT